MYVSLCTFLLLWFLQSKVTNEKTSTERPGTTHHDGHALPVHCERDPIGNAWYVDARHRDEEVHREEKGPKEEGGEGNN